jgi:methionyl-tRNA synthetase
MNITSNLNTITVWTNTHPILVGLIMAWALVWKGWALWKSAQRGQNYWFIVLLIVNTIGILDIIYIYFVAKDSKVEVIEN